MMAGELWKTANSRIRISRRGNSIDVRVVEGGPFEAGRETRRGLVFDVEKAEGLIELIRKAVGEGENT